MSIRLVAAIALAFVSTFPAVAVSKSDAGPAAATVTPSAAQSRQQNRMASCNRDATGKKGDERKAFMKACLSASTSAEAPRASKR